MDGDALVIKIELSIIKTCRDCRQIENCLGGAHRWTSPDIQARADAISRLICYIFSRVRGCGTGGGGCSLIGVGMAQSRDTGDRES